MEINSNDNSTTETPHKNIHAVNSTPKGHGLEKNDFFDNEELRREEYGGGLSHRNLKFPKQSGFTSTPAVNVALLCGSQLVGTGRGMVEQEISKFISVLELRHFFSVDTSYVINKLRVIIFPFLKKDWSINYQGRMRLHPKHNQNAPDLYIPLMGYITYVLVASLVKGSQGRFSPETLGVVAGQALAWILLEVLLQSAAAYIFNIDSNLRFLDILTYSGYKFVGITICILFRLLHNFYGYALAYFILANSFYTIQTLKWTLIDRAENLWHSLSAEHLTNTQVFYKRKMYYLVLIAMLHSIQILFLSVY